MIAGELPGMGAATMDYLNRNGMGIEICLFEFVTVSYAGTRQWKSL
jgi:hypothetical protein